MTQGLLVRALSEIHSNALSMRKATWKHCFKIPFPCKCLSHYLWILLRTGRECNAVCFPKSSSLENLRPGFICADFFSTTAACCRSSCSNLIAVIRFEIFCDINFLSIKAASKFWQNWQSPSLFTLAVSCTCFDQITPFCHNPFIFIGFPSWISTFRRVQGKVHQLFHWFRRYPCPVPTPNPTFTLTLFLASLVSLHYQ